MIVGYKLSEDRQVCLDCYEKISEEELQFTMNKKIIKYIHHDTPLHCTDCLVLIPVYLSDNGLEYILERIDSYMIDNIGRPDVLNRWIDHYYEDLLYFDQRYTVGVLLSTVERFLKKREISLEHRKDSENREEGY